MSQKRWTIAFSPAGDGEYQVTVRRSGAVHRFRTKLPPDISDLWQTPAAEDGGTQRSFRSAEPQTLSPEQRFFQAADLPTLKVIGERVLETLFDTRNGAEGPKILGALEDRIADNEGVMIEFDLSETAELSAIPWEAAYLPSHDRFLAIGTTSNLIRKLDAQSDLPAPIERPIRILVAAANPRDDLDTDVEVGNIERRIKELVSEGSDTFEVQSLPAATREDFRRKVLGWKPHIIHYIGHSAFKDGNGYLYFESAKEGESDKVSAETLRNMLLNNRPWLVVLNSCQSGQTARDAPMAGVAQNLLQRLNVPFVVAMQQPVSDDAAINFSQDFYTALTNGESIASAVTLGRCAIANDAHPLTQLELITPVLYTSGETDRILFAQTAAAPVPPADLGTKSADEKPDKEKKGGFLGIMDEKTAQMARIATSLTVVAGALVGAYNFIPWGQDEVEIVGQQDPNAGQNGNGEPTDASVTPTPEETGSTGEQDTPDAQPTTPDAQPTRPDAQPTRIVTQGQGGTQTGQPVRQAREQSAPVRVRRVDAAIPAPDPLVPPPPPPPPPPPFPDGNAENLPPLVPVAGIEVLEDFAFQGFGAPPPVTELGGGEFSYPEPAGSHLLFNDEEPLVPASDESFRRPVAICAGLAQTIYFDLGASEAQGIEAAKLGVLPSLLACPDTILVATGFADRTGDAAANSALSEERALYVADALRGRQDNFTSVSWATYYGEEQNAEPTEDGVAEPANRRVEVFVDWNCYGRSDFEAVIVDGEGELPASLPAPYPAANADGAFQPIQVVLMIDPETGDLAAARETVADAAAHIIANWEVPAGAVFPMIVGDKCLPDGETSRLVIDYPTP